MSADENNKVMGVLRTWMQSSGMDGLGHVGRARNGVAQVMWTLILLSGLVLTVYQLYWILSEYQEHPIRTAITLSSSQMVSI